MRPSTGASPMTSKKLPLITPACTCTGTSSVSIVKVIGENSAIPERLFDAVRMSVISGTEKATLSWPAPFADCRK